MARSSIHDQLFINDGNGSLLPIQTGTFVTKAINMEERRRLSLTIGVNGSTGVAGGGFTGILYVEGTDELAGSLGATGTAQAGAGQQPGNNGFTGALFWTTIPSGVANITNSLTSGGSILLSFTDVGPSWVRVRFNSAATAPAGTSRGGSGTMSIFVTAKNT